MKNEKFQFRNLGITFPMPVPWNVSICSLIAERYLVGGAICQQSGARSWLKLACLLLSRVYIGIENFHAAF